MRDRIMLMQEYRLIDLVDDMRQGRDVFFRFVRLARDIMTRNVKTLTLDDTVDTCLEFMHVNKVRHVPVIDGDAGENRETCLVGVVSERDLLRQVSPYAGKLGQEETDPQALAKKLHQVLSRDPVTVSPETSIPETIGIMLDHKFDMVPVVVGRRLMGIVTPADIINLFVMLDVIQHLCENALAGQKDKRFIDMLSGGIQEAANLLRSVLHRAEDIMTKPAVCLREEDGLAKAIELIQKENFRHILVTDDHGKLTGLISDREILSRLPMPKGQKRILSQLFRARLFDVDPRHPCLELKLGEIMKRHIVHVSSDCDFYEAVRLLHTRKISSLPVLDEEKRPCGIITASDVMRALQAAYMLIDKRRNLVQTCV